MSGCRKYGNWKKETGKKEVEKRKHENKIAERKKHPHIYQPINCDFCLKKVYNVQNIVYLEDCSSTTIPRYKKGFNRPLAHIRSHSFCTTTYQRPQVESSLLQ